MLTARVTAHTYLCRKEMAAQMGRNKTINYTSTTIEGRRRQPLFIPFFAKVDV
jgi:hypothetical protein